MDSRLENILNDLGIKNQWDEIGKEYEPGASKKEAHCGKCTWPKKGRIRARLQNNSWFNAIVGKFYYYETTNDGLQFHIYGDNSIDDGFFGPREINKYFNLDEIRNTLEDGHGGFVYDEEGNEILYGSVLPRMKKSMIGKNSTSSKRKKNADIIAKKINPEGERFGTIEDIMRSSEIL